MPNRVLISAEGDHFDYTALEEWQDEGFEVTYVPNNENLKAYTFAIESLADELEDGETYAIIAFGEAATSCLSALEYGMPKLGALIAYYPSSTSTIAKRLAHTHVIVHIAGEQGFGVSEQSYRYEGTRVGFAERGSGVWDKVASSLAWSRTLRVLKRAFNVHPQEQLERVWDEHTELEFATKDAGATIETMGPNPYVNHVPTMTGGIGKKDLYRFYQEYFVPSNPPSFKMALISRTTGVDRVVDEFIIKFRHTCEMPWILPGVAPTDKEVEVAFVSVVCIRGGKVFHEHIYWDQATVLFQIGLLNPNLVPSEMKAKGTKRMPVVGAEGARKVLDEKSEDSNELIEDWWNPDG
ncbi:carboxymethylenebutenolidase [Patellaria atrata CBS 101060]|uniref:Carboxymethylenebutenolidase n=1 Tax=Patellaria atrata CBS 101060 TaxID=1346257 RepID=A0A9P4S2E8_9PEZI|nr:carboxymethylenebutenolidase [Patellaria atrata CBS 101060]